MGIHDQTFRAFAAVTGFLDTLLRERLGRALVRQFAGPAEALSDRFVDQHLKGTIADLVVRIPLRGGRYAYVYVLLEHKRTQERLLSVQLLKYQASLYTWLAKQRRAGASAPFVVTLVIYNGAKPWRLGRRFSEILGIDRAHRSEALDFKVHVLDLSTLRAESLSRHRLVRGALTALKAATVQRSAQTALMREALANLSDDHSTRATAVSYFQSIGRFRDVRAALEEEEEKTEMQTAAQYFRARGRKEGLEKGLEKGRRAERARSSQFLRSTIERLLGRRATRARRALVAAADLDTLEAMVEALIERRPLRTVFKS